MGHPSTPPGTDYRLLIARRFDDRRHVGTTLIRLATTRSFASFLYELSVDATVAGNSLGFRVLGLKAPNLSLPASGHAEYTREFDGLLGTYEVTVLGLDGKSTTFSVRISETTVHILQKPARSFVDLIVDPKLWPAD